jgi:signal transduction histidine kinase
VQEALTNLARHSGATAAAVTIAAGTEHLIVEVGDRGRGFDVAKALAARRSLGLAGMRERVQFAGGQLEIFSRPGQGTRIHAELPLAAPSP